MKASLKRDTGETRVSVVVNIDGSGKCAIDTGVGLLDEMLFKLAKAADLDLSVSASGDLLTGDHHTVEDVAITLGCTFAKLIKGGIGSAIVPSRDGFALAAIRIGEPGYSEEFELKSHEIGGMQLENFSHFMRTLAYNGIFTLHLSARGDDDLKKIDAITLALGRALSKAILDGKK